MKKKLCLILASILILGLLAGCENKTASGGKFELLLGIPGGDTLSDGRILENFKEARKDQYVVRTDEAPWGEFTQKIKLQLAAKKDVIPVFITDCSNAYILGEQGALKDLDASVSTLDESLYTAALRAVQNPEGKLWGVPQAINSYGLVYNKDLFDERGVPYPTDEWTFEDYIAAAEKLTFERENGEKIYGMNVSETKWWEWLLATGGEPFKDNGRNSNLNDPKVKEGFEAFLRPWENGSIMDPAELSALGAFNSAFSQGKIAMSHIQISDARVIEGLNPELNFDAVLSPYGWSGRRSCIYVPNVFCVYAGVDQQTYDAVWDWISFYLSEESQMLHAESVLTGFPIMKSALDTVGVNTNSKPANKGAFYKGIDEHGATIILHPCAGDLETILREVAGKIRNKEADVETALAAAHTEMQSVLDNYYDSL